MAIILSTGHQSMPQTETEHLYSCYNAPKQFKRLLYMASIQLKSEINVELDQLLAGVEQLDTRDLEQFLMQIRYVLAHRKSPNLPALEVELLQRINQTLPHETQQQYNYLSEKMRSANISPMEHQDLLKLVDIVEQADGDRLQYLVQLSQLRNISLPDLMKQLDIHPQPVHA